MNAHVCSTCDDWYVLDCKFVPMLLQNCILSYFVLCAGHMLQLTEQYYSKSTLFE